MLIRSEKRIKCVRLFGVPVEMYVPSCFYLALCLLLLTFECWITPTIAKENYIELKSKYGRSGVPLVSMIRSYPSGSSDETPNSNIVYIPDVGSNAEYVNHSDRLHLAFARAVNNSGFLPVEETMSNLQFRILLVCSGTSIADYLYGMRAAQFVIDRNEVKISATSRTPLNTGNVINLRIGSEQAVVGRAQLDRKVNPELWTPFFEGGPAVFDTTLPVQHRSCVIEACQKDKYAFLWRASYHDDAASKVVDGLWALVSGVLPARPILQYFPDQIFVPAGELRTPVGTYRMSGFEREAWHNQWAALFSAKLIDFDEPRLYGVSSKEPMFRRLVSATQDIYGDQVITMSLDQYGDARTVYKSYEISNCATKGYRVDYVIRKFVTPSELAMPIFNLLKSRDFKEAAGDEQEAGSDGEDYLYEFLSQDGSYVARKRWSPKEDVFAKINKHTRIVIKSPVARSNSTVVARKRLHECPK